MQTERPVAKNPEMQTTEKIRTSAPNFHPAKNAVSEGLEAEAKGPVWLFSRNVDLGVFLGSASVSLLLVLIGFPLGLAERETPEWTWVSAVLLIDVAHVWSTSFRVYFDVAELRRRFFLYSAVPIFSLAIGVFLYSLGEVYFWRILALVAVFHFIRQQYGWTALYRRKIGDAGSISKVIDTAAIYLAAIYPLVFWMANLPRDFNWFVKNDFIPLPAFLERVFFYLYLAAMLVYFLRAAAFYFKYDFSAIGKDIIVATTAACWYIGIVAFNSDYIFTVTNVIIHGVPYFALIYIFARQKRRSKDAFYQRITSNIFIFLATVWLLAYLEEMLWHRTIWHERQWLFGADWQIDELRWILLPLLAVPQITHYILDGFIWRKKSNPDFTI